MQKFEGIHASDGIAIGSAFVYRPPSVSTERHAVADTDAELAGLHHALSLARERLNVIHQQSTATLESIAMSRSCSP